MLDVLFFAVVIIAIVLWYRAKFVLKAHGYPVSFVWHGSDLPNLYRLYARQTDEAEKTRVFRLLVALYSSLVALLLLILFLIFSASWWIVYAHI
jgi:hypothetical protein